ncbi:hypothetical protein cyc_09464 [Cyclospora cayetanensis]|uniref:Uncharacterized protein n=1 Tax=Cyclospora cayetanensis TaxID=88456 RepID=A0A1D3D2X5_9EIME|nr:hypothetical protein cyc_09464 [Cyclospora cayetanensis]
MQVSHVLFVAAVLSEEGQRLFYSKAEHRNCRFFCILNGRCRQPNIRASRRRQPKARLKNRHVIAGNREGSDVDAEISRPEG